MFQVFFISFFLLTVSQIDKEQESELFELKDSFSAKVLAVPQGDLITIGLDGTLISVRLSEIDSPDPRQAFARQARLFTEGLVLGQTVKIKTKYLDRYQRIIGIVILQDGRILNNELVRSGLAWHYRATPKPDQFLEELEYKAWKEKLGFWVNSSPIPPWKFRAELLTPDPPLSPRNVNYDRIFEYGLYGNKETRVYMWPACRVHIQIPKPKRVIFSSKSEAEKFGYRAHETCLE